MKKLLILVALALNQTNFAGEKSSEELSYYKTFSKPFPSNSIIDAGKDLISDARDAIITLLYKYAKGTGIGTRVFYMPLIQTQLSNDGTTAGIGNSVLFNEIFPTNQVYIKQKLQELLALSIAREPSSLYRTAIVDEIVISLEE